ncbi:uncharacterized protein Z520_08759 [Fonsecaea multimorphosa CBS 102226]|uniref:Nuclear envelope protein n=1 Tax=Fonsecaea multimorphosa CBS 102226 TaxID=1442371 RepID=A0A0D2JYI6_9EURO|nr:uncharacterized protein Z520_08759 [Fonsecaea multimorphosa CBS 102226]KIX95639.1 hypothetical protein Z520_08759 [Fonsecaea multimorphosa CBS 102226]OAL21242.1 hypothetical protein AYO22_08205 [Fonsecaea multimorphosa]
MASPAAASLNPPPRPYRRFLTSALHKRFVHAALITLLVALLDAVCLGPKKDIFWSWFPFGPAGLRALLFFMSSLFVFILQIATLNIGKQTTTSPFATFRTNFLSTSAVQTLFWYLVSGWWFTEAYIWSSPDLGWITRGNHNTPDILNERPIYFRLYALLLAVAYAGVHLYRGNSTLLIPVSKLPSTPNPDTKAQDTHPVEPIQTRLLRKLLSVLIESTLIPGAMIVVAPFIYGLFLRNIFWQLHLAMAKPFFNLSRANARPVGYPLLGLGYLFRCFGAGFLLILTWELTSLLFLIYLNQQPTKSGLPLSASSKDPNGTLLNGLKAKRDVVRTFAFWELAIIAHKHKERRKAIFEDIERPTGPMWSQMVQAALKILQEVQIRIVGPPAVVPQPSAADQIKSLPRIVPEVPSQSIFQGSPKPSVGERLLASPLRQIGSSKQPWHPPIEQTAKSVETKLLEYAKPPGSAGTPAKSLADQWMTALKQSRIGWFFVSTNAARINAMVLGSPHGNAALIVDVIESITKMQVASLTEDTYGKATPTVPDTVRTFTKTLNIIEDYVSKNKQGVTDDIEEVEIIIARLRAGLKELLSAFQVYLIDQGLGIADLNQAKKAVQVPDLEEVQEKPKPRAVEQQTQRRLFQKDAQKDGAKDRQRISDDKIPRLEPSGWSGSNPQNGRLFQRREMEQVR